MSFDWQGRGGQASGGRARSPLAVAQEARELMQEQFYRVDQLQRDVGGTVELYADLLADRASASGVVPGWRALDQRANQLVMDYLNLLDKYDPLEESVLPALQQAIGLFNDLTRKLGPLADDMEQFLTRFGPELQKVGQAKQAVRERADKAAAAVARAESAWRAMRADGYEFDEVDRAFAQASVANRKLAGLADRLTLEQVDEPARLVERLAEEAYRLAVELPERVAGLETRIPSLLTRADALETRAASVPESMGALRREFSMGNWRDIADREQDLAELLSDARTRLREMRMLHRSGDYPAALEQLKIVEEDLRSAGELVDGPRQRLEHLREVKAHPHQLFEKVRFQLRDARYLIQRGGTTAPQPWGGRLDAAASELIAIEGLLDTPHPDYLALSRRLDELEQRIRQLIADYRS